MILEKTSLSMAETLELANSQENPAPEVTDFINKFIKTKPESAKKLRKELEALGLAKIGHEHITKIIDLLPTTALEINKILINENLNEDEINKILEITKKYV